MTNLKLMDILPLRPGPFVKAPCTKPYRPVLHQWEDDLAVHTEVVNSDGTVEIIEGFYVPLDAGERQIRGLLEDYAVRCSRYFNDVAVIHERGYPDDCRFLL